uniref:Ionotropic glutamate receptor C-terminal domain-containing protein n=1 Tax=Glossina pallidipes TaxID=7398 RepID=A0A1A9ZJ07_GLOPL
MSVLEKLSSRQMEQEKLRIASYSSSFLCEFNKKGALFRCIGDRFIEHYGFSTEILNSCQNKLGSRSERINRLLSYTGNSSKNKTQTRTDILMKRFNLIDNSERQRMSLIKLINKIAKEYLSGCSAIIYYDSFVQNTDYELLRMLFKSIPLAYQHAELDEQHQPRELIHSLEGNCNNFILFLTEPRMARKVIGPQLESKVVIISRSSQWKLRDFLASKSSADLLNLLVIGESQTYKGTEERPFVLYTHNLYVDGLGSNTPHVLTSWLKGSLSRPHLNLFPIKFQNGFAGHRFRVFAASQPPFIFRSRLLDSRGEEQFSWEGIEYRLLNIFGKKLNFSLEILDTRLKEHIKRVALSPVENLQLNVAERSADIGMAGIYVTTERLIHTDMSVGHSKDCAVFVTLASKALPKYRAIMGPFQWPVWMTLTFVYLGAVFPIAFSDRLSLSHLLGNWGEIENMFWYVFGMFTNAFSCSSRYAWSNTRTLSTRILIGSYWIFTIILTSCYTGSIIAFVTLPAFPNTVDSVKDLLGLFFKVGTLDSGGWENWFRNSSHEPTAKLYEKMEFVSSLEEGIGNVTKSFFWNFAFLGSKAQLQYLVQSNFSNENLSRRSALHLSEECFALFQVGFLYPRHAIYRPKIDDLILLAQQSGLILKLENEVKWTMQRSASGKLLQASSSNPLREVIQEERQLTTADIAGMLLLMGIGYLMGFIALISEIVGGITNKCRQIMQKNRLSSSSASSRSSADSVKQILTIGEKSKIYREYEINVRRKNAPKDQMTFLSGINFKELHGNPHNLQADVNPKKAKNMLKEHENDGELVPKRYINLIIDQFLNAEGFYTFTGASNERVQQLAVAAGERDPNASMQQLYQEQKHIMGSFIKSDNYDEKNLRNEYNKNVDSDLN